MNKKNIIYPLLVLAAGILWGTMGLLVRTMNKKSYDSMEIVVFRAIFTAILMLGILLIVDRKALKIRLKDLWCFLGTGIVSIVFFNTCYFSCMKYTTLSVAAILLYTAPSFVMVMSYCLFKEKFTGRKLLCLILTFAGCVLVSGGFGGAHLSVKGLLLGLGAGFGYAMYSIFSRFAIQRGYSSLTITTYTFIFAAIGSSPLINWKHMTSCIKGSGTSLIAMITMVIFNTVLAYIVYTKGLEGMDNGKASIIASIEPVMASIVGIVVYSESITIMGTMGMILVLLGCIILNISGSRADISNS